MIKDLVKIIQSNSYRDPALEFILALFVDYDFKKATEKLKQCDDMIEKDFFLIGTKEAFDENARAYFIENYCRVNKRIDIGALASTLEMSASAVEASIVTLIRQNKLNARIDAEAGIAHVRVETKSINEQIIDDTFLSRRLRLLRFSQSIRLRPGRDSSLTRLLRRLRAYAL